MADWMQFASENKDWQFDFAGELLDADTISSVIDVSTNAPDLVVDQVSHTDNLVRFWLSGGTAGSHYAVAATVSTAAGRTLTMEAVMYIK